MGRWLLALLTLGLYAVVCSADDSESSGPLHFKVEHHCNKFNKQYMVGEVFEHPSKQCTNCTCCKTGKVACKKNACPKDLDLQCGSGRFVDVDGDECCYECDEACKTKHQTDPSCNDAAACPGEFIFPKDACCGDCGCRTFRGELVPPTIGEEYVDTEVHPACEKCQCKNGVFSCEEPVPCPGDRLKCVDGKINKDTCEWYCPNGEGKTCFVGNKMIVMSDSNKAELVDERLCWCHFGNGVFFPEAMCSPKTHEGKIERALYEHMCVNMPISYTAWGAP